MQYQVLGPLEVQADDGPIAIGGRQQRLLLALLIVNLDRVVVDDRLIDGLWGTEAPEGAKHSLQTYVYELRRLLDERILREGSGYRLGLDPDAVDSRRFERWTLEARGQGVVPAERSRLLRQALALWKGDPYADLSDAPALQPEVHRLGEARLAALEDRISADLEMGRQVQVATELEALTREHPYRERLHEFLMLSLYRSGRQVDALRAYDRARQILIDQLGIEPSADLQRMLQRILAQDPDLAGPEISAASGPGGPELGQQLPVVRGFEMREKIGEGDFGVTYRAYQGSVGREVAVKVFRSEYVSNRAFLLRFENRTRLLASLDHPNVVPVLDAWREPDGAYVVTPWMRRGSAGDSLRQGPWSLEATLRMLDRIGAALASMHRKGIVHGNVTSSSVLFDSDGNAMLTDFALVARAAADGAARPSVISPEERRARPLTPASDIYALAVLVAEVLIGAGTAVDHPIDKLRRHRPELPETLITVLERATADDPARRQGRVEDLLRDVRQALGIDTAGWSIHREEASASPRNPYKGLRAFQESDAPDFFGREAFVDRLIDGLRRHRLLAVVGPSGSGKSSAVRAGLLAALRAGALPGSETWLISDMYPGSHPFEELEAALLRVAVDRPPDLLAGLIDDDLGLLRAVKQVLPGDDSQLLLVIDQFEELYSLTHDATTQRLFVDNLVAAHDDARSRLRLVITLRADFFDRPLEHHAFGELLRQGLVAVTSPSAEELIRAINEPARQTGVEFEDGLLSTIVGEVIDQPGGLPLLQHALSELFGNRDGRRLTFDRYRAIGGVNEALGRRAEQVYRALPPDGRSAAQQVFLRLLTVDEGGEATRRRVQRGELADLGLASISLDRVIHDFGTHRLLTFDRDPLTRGPTVEVAHEALLREWSTLREWVASRREALILHRRLSAATSDWVGSGGSSDFLFRGERLTQYEQWLTDTDLALTVDERRFLAESRASHDKTERGRRRRRRWLVQASLLVAAVTTLLLALALSQRGRAVTEERTAVARALAFESQSQLLVDHDNAVRLALEAVETTRGEPPLPEAVDALHAAVLNHRVVMRAPGMGLFLGFLGDTGRMFSAFEGHTVWDRATGETIHRLAPTGSEMTGRPAVSSDGRFIAETYVDAPATVWDSSTGEVVAMLDAARIQVGPALSPDGRLLANLLEPGQGAASRGVIIWDVASGEIVTELEEVGETAGLLFSPDGRQLVLLGAASVTARLYDIASGEFGPELGDPEDHRVIADAAFDPAGRTLALLANPPAELDLIDLDSGQVVRTIALGVDGGRVCFTGDGAMLAVATADEIIRIFDAAGVQELTRLPGDIQVNGLTCGAGAMVGSTNQDGTAFIYDLGAAAASEVLSVAVPQPSDVVWTADGAGLITTHLDGGVRRFESGSGELAAESFGLLPLGPDILRSPDGRFAVALSDDAPPRLVLYEADSLAPIREMESDWPALAFSSDSSLLLSGGFGVGRLFETASGRLAREYPVPAYLTRPFDVASGTLTPDGRYVILAAAGRPETWLLDFETGEIAATVCGLDGGRVLISPDGSLLARADFPGNLVVWDVERLLALAGTAEECDEPARAASDEAVVTTMAVTGVEDLRFDPDGQSLVAASYDGVLSVWDAFSGDRMARIEHNGTLGVDFSPDGRHLAVAFNHRGGTDHALRIYTLQIEELLAIARSKLGG